MAVSPLRLRPEEERAKRWKPPIEEFDCEVCGDVGTRERGSTRTYCSKSRCTSEGRREAGRRGGAARLGGDINVRRGEASSASPIPTE